MLGRHPALLMIDDYMMIVKYKYVKIAKTVAQFE